MLDGMSVIVAAIGYVCALFLIAWWGDAGGRRFIASRRPLIYSLSLAVYCTTWTYYGSVVIAQSLVKLVAFLAVGAFVAWGMFGGIGDLTHIAQGDPRIAAVMETPPDAAVWIVTTLLSALAILLLPRQFHVTIVENRGPRDIK